MVRFITYGIKMMKRYRPQKFIKESKVLYYLKDIKEITDNIENIDVLGIIVPFLYSETIPEVQKKIDDLLEIKGDLQIFVISIFASMDVMTKLTVYKDNIYVINILCIVDMTSLLKMLQDNCKLKNFDFCGNSDFIKLLEESSNKELARKDGPPDY